MVIPTLLTERLALMPPCKEAEDLYDSFHTNADASREYGGPLNSAAAWSRLASDLGSWFLHGFGVWVVQRREGGELLGTCGFWQGKGWPRELTWWLLPEARGFGLAHEASVAALTHAYEVFGWQSVETFMKDANAPARRLAERLGGKKVGRKSFPDGLERDVYYLPAPGRQPPLSASGC